MKVAKLAIAVAALSYSAAASAMPRQVPGKWWDLMDFRLAVMANNPGFCQAYPESWICWTL